MRGTILRILALSLVIGGLSFVNAAPTKATSMGPQCPGGGGTLTEGQLQVNYWVGNPNGSGYVTFTYTAQGCYNGSNSWGTYFPTPTITSSNYGLTNASRIAGQSYYCTGSYTNFWANYDQSQNVCSLFCVSGQAAYDYPRRELFPNGSWGEWDYQSGNEGTGFYVVSVRTIW